MPFLSREFFRRVFIRDRLVLGSLLGTVLVQMLTWALLLWRGLPLRGREFIPLHYNIYFGVDLIGPWYQLFLPAFVGGVTALVNGAFVVGLYERERLIAYLFAGGSVVIEVVLLAASAFSLLLNI